MGAVARMTPAQARAERRSASTVVIDMPNAHGGIGHNSGGTDLVLGGGLEGASRTDREMMLWRPNFGSPDAIINGVKDIADARSRDMVQNDGYATGAVQTHRDSIVGSVFRLNAQPEWSVMGFATEEAGEAWIEDFQTIVETRFNLTAESNNHWLDASRRMTLTEMLRLSVGAFVYTGEVCASVEWIRESNRPCQTAIQLISPDRLTNPQNLMDTRFLKRGIEMDFRGKHLAYNVRNSHPGEWFDYQSATWTRVEAEKPWGRKQFLFINEPLQIDQTRGVADMVACLKLLKMTKNLSEVTLQNAVINASYAAAVESEAPNADIITALGGGDNAAGYENAFATYLGMLGSYVGQSNNIAIDGAKIPHLFPGTKLSLKPVGTPGGVGTGFEASLLRKIAATLGISYEELARDYSKVSYSSARASMSQTWRFMQSRKKIVADKLATMIYTLWLEEEIASGNIPLPPHWTRDTYYQPLMAEAVSQCSWIGSGRGQIDELKETQAAILRIKSGLSTYEEESARLGNDFRRTFRQAAREQKLIKKYGLAFALDAQKKSDGTGTQSTLQDPKAKKDKGAKDKGTTANA